MSNLPPTNIPAVDTWTEMTQVPRPFRLYDLPRNHPTTGKPVGKIALVPLTEEENTICAAAAERFTRQVLKEIPRAEEARRGYDDVYNNAATVEILYRCLRKPENLEQHWCPSPAALRKTLTPDEIAVLMNHYLTMREETAPIVSSMTEEEVDAWVKRLAEGGSRFPLDLLSSEATKTLVLFMASRLHTFLTDTSSAGSPHDEPTESASSSSTSPASEDDDAPVIPEPELPVVPEG